MPEQTSTLLARHCIRLYQGGCKGCFWTEQAALSCFHLQYNHSTCSCPHTIQGCGLDAHECLRIGLHSMYWCLEIKTHNHQTLFSDCKLHLCTLRFNKRVTLPTAGTPRAVAQSALGFGAFSYVIDRMGQQPANAAAMTVCSEADGSCKRLWRRQVRTHTESDNLALPAFAQDSLHGTALRHGPTDPCSKPCNIPTRSGN